MKVSLYRRQRSARFDWEWHNYSGVRFIRITVGHPKVHCWWAFSLYLYLTGA